MLDYCPVDPARITFIRDAGTGKLTAAVAVGGAPQPLSATQFRYLPLDPDVDDPYGRGPFWPALETAFFQMEVLGDLKAVAHNQGYPRIDVSLLQEIVYDNAPAHLRQPGRENDLRQWLDGYLSDLQTQYNALNPDDAFIHWDWVKVGMAEGAGKASIDVTGLPYPSMQELLRRCRLPAHPNCPHYGKVIPARRLTRQECRELWMGE